jgi:hypothetical protein
MLFRKIISAFSDNHVNPINTLFGEGIELLNVNAGGTYSYHRTVRGKQLKVLADCSISFSFFDCHRQYEYS